MRSNFRVQNRAFFRTHGSSGKEKLCAFCQNCGTRIYHAGGATRSAGSDTLSIKAGTLDDTSRITPTCHLWTKSAQPWLTPLVENSLCFETEPESQNTLRAQWRDTQSANR